MTWNSAAVIAMRTRLGLDRADFVKLAGADLRSVTRWETNRTKSECVLTAVREKLESDPENAHRVVAYVVGAVRVGGLAYLLLKLLDAAIPKAKARA